MSVAIRFRDALNRLVPPWLSDRTRTGPGLNVGYRVLWAIVAPLDAAADYLVQGIRAPWPGVGTPTALPAIGRTRGILRGYGLSETDAHYAERLINWLATWKTCGSQLAIATQLHEYISNRPRVTVINRAGRWTRVNQDGSVDTGRGSAWNWDGTSNPERSGNWWELWVIVYPDPWTYSPTIGSGQTIGGRTAPDGSIAGIGHTCSREEYDAIRSLLQTWKAARTFVRALLFTSSSTAYNPDGTGLQPDGTWGQWSQTVNGVTGLAILNGGSGYTHASASFAGGGGSGASATATISGGAVTGFDLQPGSGFTAAPTVSISGDGSGASVEASIGTCRVASNRDTSVTRYWETN